MSLNPSLIRDFLKMVFQLLDFDRKLFLAGCFVSKNLVARLTALQFWILLAHQFVEVLRLRCVLFDKFLLKFTYFLKTVLHVRAKFF